MRAFVSELPAPDSLFKLEGEEAYHLLRVKRIEDREKVELLDGRGGRAQCFIHSREKRTLILNVQSNTHESRNRRTGLFLGLPVQASTFSALLPGLVQVGVTHIYPGETEFSGRWKKYGNPFDRWTAIMRQSLKQCGRSWLPEIHAFTFQHFLEEYEVDNYHWKHLYHPGGKSWQSFSRRKPSHSDLAQQNSILCFVGPEGGFSASEIELACEKGVSLMDLGHGILKLETAAVCTAFRAEQWVREYIADL
jgi:16S rRNA (uracil1498-N3)-methyltransferase